MNLPKSKTPAWVPVLWALCVIGDCEDRDHPEGTPPVSRVPLEGMDLSEHADLAGYAAVDLWEDDMGKVRYRRVRPQPTLVVS